MRQLAKYNVIRKRRSPHLCHGNSPCDPSFWHRKQVFEVNWKLTFRAQFSMRPKRRIRLSSRQKRRMVGSPPKHMLAHVPPSISRTMQWTGSVPQSQPHVLDENPMQRRLGIRPTALIRYPIGSQIPFLKSMNAHVVPLGARNRIRMDRTTCAIAHKVRHTCLKLGINRFSPCLRRTVIRLVTRQPPPKQSIAGIETDPRNRRLCRHQMPREPCKKRSMRTL